ncbi:hypothetical protein Bca101_006635 [Brassica carinata]
MVMVVGETSMELDQCFQMTMMNMEGVSIKEWKDIPVELLMRILPLVDDRNVIAASGVCSGWRDAISLGLTRLRLSCSDLSSLHLSKMTTLESLKFEPLEAFSDKAIAYLTRSCRNLLWLSRSEDSGLVWLCSHYRNITDRAMYPLAQSGPMHCAYTFGRSSGLRYVSCSSHVFGKTFACDERVFELNVCALCLYPSGSSRGSSLLTEREGMG